jgi:hypothetical protein
MTAVTQIVREVVEVTARGPQGLSAYQIAVAEGFVGTQQQWLAALTDAADHDAEIARDFAREWATNPVDLAVNDNVNPVGFSSFHWSEKAGAAQTAAESARDAALAAVPNVFPVTRTALKALDTAAVTSAYLKESGREGQFIWTAGDYSTQIVADTSEAVYIKADAIAATAGAWVRANHHRQINAEWTGGDIQAAENLAFTLGWDTVYLTKDYVLPGDLAPRAGVKLLGLLRKRKLSAPSVNYEGNLINCNTNSAHRAAFENIIVDGRAVWGAELVTNGDFSVGTGWNLGPGWSIAAGKAIHAAGTAAYLSQSVAVSDGMEVWIEYTVSGRTAGSITPRLTGGSADVVGTSRSADGTYVERFTVANGSTLIVLGASATFDGSIDNVTLKVPPRRGTFGRLVFLGAANDVSFLKCELNNSPLTGIQSADAVGWRIEDCIFRNIPWGACFHAMHRAEVGRRL